MVVLLDDTADGGMAGDNCRTDRLASITCVADSAKYSWPPGSKLARDMMYQRACDRGPDDAAATLLSTLFSETVEAIRREIDEAEIGRE